MIYLLYKQKGVCITKEERNQNLMMDIITYFVKNEVFYKYGLYFEQGYQRSLVAYEK